MPSPLFLGLLEAVLFLICPIFFFFFGAGNWTQDLTQARVNTELQASSLFPIPTCFDCKPELIFKPVAFLLHTLLPFLEETLPLCLPLAAGVFNAMDCPVWQILFPGLLGYQNISHPQGRSRDRVFLCLPSFLTFMDHPAWNKKKKNVFRKLLEKGLGRGCSW